ncbi:hypothetical protein CRG98_009257 [Punica granatum]|uniref:Uncharacterized protein n=1 Tax=Punica granatum TaxID=22663 RepID=A0A2I0KPG1_PUNGR|nr:hypothetical protein CRG98_009257 [Punica granatum]
MYNDKRKVRRAIEEAGIPYTYICCNSIAVWPHHDNTHPSADGSFPDHGNGNVKGLGAGYGAPCPGSFGRTPYFPGWGNIPI